MKLKEGRQEVQKGKKQDRVQSTWEGEDGPEPGSPAAPPHQCTVQSLHNDVIPPLLPTLQCLPVFLTLHH